MFQVSVKICELTNLSNFTLKISSGTIKLDCSVKNPHVKVYKIPIVLMIDK